MTEINLKTLNKGDTIVLRCGGEIVVEGIPDNAPNVCSVRINGGHLSFYMNGRYAAHDIKHSFDVVEIKPARFDWSTVRPGMAFKVPNGTVVYYVGPDIFNPELSVFTRRDIWEGDVLMVCHKNTVVRAPEQDLPETGEK